MSAYVLRLLDYSTGQTDPDHSGRYVAQYEPAPWGEPSLLVTTANPDEAIHFADPAEAVEFWRRENGLRPHDGKPNRPLTAFTVTAEPLRSQPFEAPV